MELVNRDSTVIGTTAHAAEFISFIEACHLHFQVQERDSGEELSGKKCKSSMKMMLFLL